MATGGIGAVARHNNHGFAGSRPESCSSGRYLARFGRRNDRIANGPGLMPCPCEEKGSGQGFKKIQGFESQGFENHGEACSQKDKNFRWRTSADGTRR
jgi:hypothetical protein